MAERWGRIAAGFHSNPKAVVAGMHGRAVFVFAICLNAGDAADGRIRRGYFGPNYLAHQLGISIEEAAVALDAAVNAGLLRIEDQHVVIVGWDAEWAPPKPGATRQAALRRKRADKCDASVTTGDGGVTSGDDIREDKRRDKKRSVSANRGTQISPDWIPNKNHTAIAIECGVDLKREAERFRDWAEAKGQVFKQWDKAFSNWLRNDRYRTPAKRPQQNIAAILAAANAEVER